MVNSNKYKCVQYTRHVQDALLSVNSQNIGVSGSVRHYRNICKNFFFHFVMQLFLWLYFSRLPQATVEQSAFSKFEEKKKQQSDKRKQTVRSIFRKGTQGIVISL